MTVPREPAEQGRLALAVRGAGSVHQLRVEPLDVYRFEFLTSRYADLAAHIRSWPGTVDQLPEIAPAATALDELFASTALGDLMRSGADPTIRQSAFDRWTVELAVALRRAVDRLEVSRRLTAGATEFLLIESPEPLPVSEDVEIALVRIEEDASRTPIGTALLSDATECRIYVLPLSSAGVPQSLPAGAYELLWTISRARFRSATAVPDATLAAQAAMVLAL